MSQPDSVALSALEKESVLACIVELLNINLTPDQLEICQHIVEVIGRSDELAIDLLVRLDTISRAPLKPTPTIDAALGTIQRSAATESFTTRFWATPKPSHADIIEAQRLGLVVNAPIPSLAEAMATHAKRAWAPVGSGGPRRVPGPPTREKG